MTEQSKQRISQLYRDILNETLSIGNEVNQIKAIESKESIGFTYDMELIISKKSTILSHLNLINLYINEIKIIVDHE